MHQKCFILHEKCIVLQLIFNTKITVLDHFGRKVDDFGPRDSPFWSQISNSCTKMMNLWSKIVELSSKMDENRYVVVKNGLPNDAFSSKIWFSNNFLADNFEVILTDFKHQIKKESCSSSGGLRKMK